MYMERNRSSTSVGFKEIQDSLYSVIFNVQQ